MTNFIHFYTPFTSGSIDTFLSSTTLRATTTFRETESNSEFEKDKNKHCADIKKFGDFLNAIPQQGQNIL
jgi:hypothetical protein